MLGKRERNRQEKRERILESAFAVFAKRGFEPVTVAEVAERAGVSRATVFVYFPSKHALVDAITGGVMAYYQGMLDRALELAETPVPTLIRALFDQMAEGIEPYRELNRGVFREIVKLQVGLEDGSMAESAGGEAADLLTKLLFRGQERGELRRSLGIRDLTFAFDSLANGTIVHWLFHDDSDPLRDRMRNAADLFLRATATKPQRAWPRRLPDLTPPTPVRPEGWPREDLAKGDLDDEA